MFPRQHLATPLRRLIEIKQSKGPSQPGWGEVFGDQRKAEGSRAKRSSRGQVSLDLKTFAICHRDLIRMFECIRKVFPSFEERRNERSISSTPDLSQIDSSLSGSIRKKDLSK